jgi:hypothetical protein
MPDVDFVGADVFDKRFVDGLVEASKELGHGFVRASEQLSHGTVAIVSHGDAASGMEYSDCDVPIANQFRNVGQIRRDDTGVVGDDSVV